MAQGLLHSSFMILHHQLFPTGADIAAGTPLVIVPGLFGSIANWRSVARELSEHRTVIVVDQRNHGRSSHMQTNTYADMVEDLNALIQHLGISVVDLAGHSMGGKVTMLFALAFPKLVRSLVVLDVAPITYAHSHAPLVQALINLELNSLRSRADADKQLQGTISDTPTRLFLLQSLAGSPLNYHWRLNLPVLLDAMTEISGFPEVQSSNSLACWVLRGEKSDYVLSEHMSEIQRLFPQCQIVDIPDAGHWLHAEQPASVIAFMNSVLEK